MSYQIRKAAVIGSGTMGSGIAALLAGVGVETLLLDIPAKDTKPSDSPAKRNKIVLDNLKNMGKLKRGGAIFSPSDLALITTGNTEDDLHKVSAADWIIEVIVEKLDVKQALMAKLAEHIHPHAIVSSNTSGLPINDIAAELPADFKRRFLGTHFFNPPRFLKLLEIIPNSATDPAVVEFMLDFGSRVLGKGVVLCKDTPNFIGNRFMSMSGMQAMNYALDHDYTVEEVDAITGQLIGRPNTATFRLNDLVGFDIAVYVARNLYPAIPNDPAREVLAHEGAKKLSDTLLERKWLGAKSGNIGFYKTVTVNGKKEFHPLNLKTLEHEPAQPVAFESVEKHRKVRNTGERLRLLINETDRAGEYLFHLHAFYLAYASHRVPEITDTLVNIDNAQKWGFAHEMGPFEIWDAIGVAETIERFEAAGYPVADWVKQMVASGKTTFYQKNDKGKLIGYYSPEAGAYVPYPRDPHEITVADLKADGKELWSNKDGAVYDMGEGVLLWEFRSKQNTITAAFIEAGYKALEILHEPQYVALVVGNDGERFSIGANLQEAMMGGLEGIEQAIKALQDFTLAMKYAPKPVVTAPFNLALGGGCEIALAGTAMVAHCELYMGLVEFGVGLVPAGGGFKELIRRVINPIAEAGADLLNPVQKIFENIALAKVSENGGAKEARDMGFLAPTDKIVMNRAHLLYEAKQVALALAKTYSQRPPEKVYAAGRDLYSALMVGLAGFKEAGMASEYDGFIAQKIAKILTGGALAQPQWVEPQYIFALERQAFIELSMQEKTQQRVMYMLQNNKPLRN
jgi:3-hydroxyacyl-CoA dehydrogenase